MAASSSVGSDVREAIIRHQHIDGRCHMDLFKLLGTLDPDVTPGRCKLHLATWNGVHDPLDLYLEGVFDEWQSDQPSGHPPAAPPKYRQTLFIARARGSPRSRRGSDPVMNEEKHWSMVRGLRKTGDVLARSDLCHLHDGRAEAESCALDEKFQGQDRDVVLVARSGSNQHVWVVLRSLSEIINGRLLPKALRPRRRAKREEHVDERTQDDDHGQGRRVRLAGGGAGRQGPDPARGHDGRPHRGARRHPDVGTRLSRSVGSCSGWQAVRSRTGRAGEVQRRGGDSCSRLVHRIFSAASWHGMQSASQVVEIVAASFPPRSDVVRVPAVRPPAPAPLGVVHRARVPQALAAPAGPLRTPRASCPRGRPWPTDAPVAEGPLPA